MRRGVKLIGGARLSVALGGERVREVVAGRRGGFGWAVAGRPAGVRTRPSARPDRSGRFWAGRGGKVSWAG